MSGEIVYSKGLRKIRPYYSIRTSFAKGRWLGLSLLDVLSKEFRAFNRDQYMDGIRKGNYSIVRAGIVLTPLQVLTVSIQNKDIVTTKAHKHEPPVKQWCSMDNEIQDNHQKVAGIDILHENDDLLVINKPCGIPVHPTGQYYQNTLTEILKIHGKEAYPCYRLDKVTSGVLIMAKTQQIASDIQSKIRKHDMNKFYLARVKGKFPKMQNQFTSDVSHEDNITKMLISENKTTISSNLFTIQLKRQFPSGLSPSKSARTDFYPIKYFPQNNQSLILCRPLTGRTHQIRIHLARLGFPIVNDPFYNIDISKYPYRAEFIIDNDNWEGSKFDQNKLKEIFDNFIKEHEEVQTTTEFNKGVDKCNECGVFEINDPHLSELGLYLHAWRYSDDAESFAYQTKLPYWAEY